MSQSPVNTRPKSDREMFNFGDAQHDWDKENLPENLVISMHQ